MFFLFLFFLFAWTHWPCSSQCQSKNFSPHPHPTPQVLSADRVEQMTKTYNDMEVVTQLLVEVEFFFVTLSKLPTTPRRYGIILLAD